MSANRGYALRGLRLLPFFLLLLVFAPHGVQANGGNLAAEPPPDLSVLIPELQSPDLRTRREAARKLSAINPLPPEATAAALRALKDPDPARTVQNYAVRALGHAGTSAVPALTAMLQDQGLNQESRVEAVHALGAMAPQEPAARPPLVAALKDPVLQAWAANEIAKIGAPVVPTLKKFLEDPDVHVRRSAASAFQMRSGEAREAIPDLTNALKDADQNVRALAAVDLARIGPQAKSAAPELTALLNDPRPEVHDAAAYALATVDPYNPAAVPVLIRAVENQQSVAHSDALNALKGMGSTAQDAVPTLERLLASGFEPRFRAAIAKMLRSVAGPDALPALVRSLTSDRELEVRRAALDAIREFGPAATAVIPGLIQALRDEDQPIRASAAETLAAIGKPAIPGLLAALNSPDLYIREGAVTALSKPNPLPDEVVRALTAVASNDKSVSVRYQAADALDRAGVAAGHSALEKAQQEMAASRWESPTFDANRLYRRDEIFADIPPDNDHEYPLRLVYLLSFNEPRREMLAAVYRGKDRRDRLIFWRQSGDHQYQQLQVTDAGPDLSDRFDPPKRVSISKGQVLGLGVAFIDVGVSLWRSRGDYLFAIDSDEVRPVEIESPELWYGDKLQPGDEIVSPSGNTFHDNEAGFSFYVRKGKKTEQVVGTYTVVRSGGGATYPPGSPIGAYAPGSAPVVRETPPKWKLMVDSATREPIPPR